MKGLRVSLGYLPSNYAVIPKRNRGFEPLASYLEGRRSTTELIPQ